MFSGSKNIESIGKLFLEFKKYLELQKEFVKLDAAEKLTVILTTTLTIVVMLLLGAIVLLFLAFAMAYYASDALGSELMGFSLVAAVVLMLGLIFYANRGKLVVRPLARFIARLFLDHENGSKQ